MRAPKKVDFSPWAIQRSASSGLSLRPEGFPVDPFTETPDAIFDVIDGGFGTIPGLRYGIGTNLKWKLEDTPVTCGDGILLASPRHFEIFDGVSFEEE